MASWDQEQGEKEQQGVPRCVTCRSLLGMIPSAGTQDGSWGIEVWVN